MPRASVSPSGRILAFFRSADLPVARLVLDLARDAVREREQRSAEAKGRAVQRPGEKKGTVRRRPKRRPSPAGPRVAEAGDAPIQ